MEHNDEIIERKHEIIAELNGESGRVASSVNWATVAAAVLVVLLLLWLL